MARKGRKQLTVLIKEESFAALEQIKEDLGLSNAKVVEMLIENYININTNINTNKEYEILKKLDNLQAQVQLLVNERSQVQAQAPEPSDDNSTYYQGRKLAPNEKVIIDEYGNEMLCIDDVPDFQKVTFSPQDFYDLPPVKEEYIPDPDDEIDAMMLRAGMR